MEYLVLLAIILYIIVLPIIVILANKQSSKEKEE